MSEPTAETLREALHEQVKREWNAKIMAIIALDGAGVVSPADAEGPSPQQ